MNATNDSAKLWSKFLLKLKMQNPFFSTLAMFATFELNDNITHAQTQHKKLVISPAFLQQFSEQQQFSYMLHQVLHLALQHIKRGEGRNQPLWNIAADISVNQIISDTTDWPIAPMTAWDHRFKGHSVERIYASLQKEVVKTAAHLNALAVQSSFHAQNSSSDGKPKDDISTEQINAPEHLQGIGETQAIEQLIKLYEIHADFSTLPSEETELANTYWRSAATKATQLHPDPHYGNHSDSLAREVELSCKTQLDWRQMLWKYATPTLSDYTEFDNRFIYCGYYTETLQAESLSIDVIIDTSGSISKRELSSFVSEMIAIKRCHPLVNIKVYYADDELYGPFEMPEKVSELQMPIGWGGTSFAPYFNALKQKNRFTDAPQAVIYFTDGFGDYPAQAPSIPVLWLITEDGCDDSNVPFGIIVRLKETSV
ncbi:VWA-like domain-containing protein [Motilimonas cestriensis]|uniref:VWA-like domain-containing protein n=1 Tax=Motilimonas cestriensis TaxID=2742685 RepID=A0ABS8WE01_9GAMM|nr:VWA-like domain-containing protein [Motilimonas cestriensis]MCE2596352.1 VWA-like domain-containing protein [Motilimonas cestriensis]